MELKEFKTYEELLDILKSKGLLINDESRVVDFLNMVSYYHFSGYFLPFIEKDSRRFRKNISFERLKEVYLFDTEIRNLIMAVIDEIEIYLKNQISHYHSNKYGAEGYMNGINFGDKHDHGKFIQQFKFCIEQNKRSSIVLHHKKRYNGRFPLWVAMEFFSIGMVSCFYRDMKNTDKSILAKNMYGVNYQSVESWLRCLTDVRNKCAHYTRLYYWLFPAIPRIPKGDKFIATRRLFTQVYMLKLLYPNKQNWNDFFVESLEKILRKYGKFIAFEHLDFPENWKLILSHK